MTKEKVARHQKQPTVVKVVCLTPLKKLQIVVYEKIDTEVASLLHIYVWLSAGQPENSDCNCQQIS